MAFNGFSIPPISIPPIGSPGPPDLPPDQPLPTEPFPPPSITIPFPTPIPQPNPTVEPVPTTTVAPTHPTPSFPASSSSSLSSLFNPSSSRQVASTPISSSPALSVSSPPSNIGEHTTDTTSTLTTPPSSPTGQLRSPSQPPMSFLQNRGARAGVFTVAAIVLLSLLLGVGAIIHRRRKRKQFDLDHVEAMAGYHNRAPIDGDDEYPSSHSHTNTTYHYSHTDELAPSYSYPGMRERHLDDPAYTVSPYLPTSGTYHEEYDPYRENPFRDGQFSPTREGYGSRPLDQEADDDYKTGSEESTLQPPQRWPQLAQLPAAFGNRSSDVIERPRPMLRVTNGLDDSHA